MSWEPFVVIRDSPALLSVYRCQLVSWPDIKWHIYLLSFPKLLQLFAWAFYTFPFPELSNGVALLSKCCTCCSPKLRMKGHLSAAEKEQGISKLPLQSHKLGRQDIALGTTAVQLWSFPLNIYLQKLSSSVMPRNGYLVLPHHTSVS